MTRNPGPTAPSGRDGPALPPGYTLVRELTRGSGAWTAQATSARGPVVLRVASGGDAEEERSAELRVLAGIDHPGLARLVDHGSLPGGGSFVARTWVDGRDLRFHLADSVRTGDARAREIAALLVGVCEALAVLHDAGFVHADVKAENVIVASDGRPVLTDFGLARATGARSAAGTAFGSTFAIAPEVLLGGAITPASDLFGLGMTFVRALVSEHARAAEFYARFPGEGALACLRIAPQELPEWCRDLIESLLSTDPARRPRDARVVAATLAGRLGLARPARTGVPRLGFPLLTGRESFVEARIAAWRARGPADRFVVETWNTPGDEPSAAWAEEARLFAALRGVATRALDLDELAERSESELDGLARELAASSAGIVWFTGRTPDARSARVLEHVARAARQRSERGESAPATWIVVAPARGRAPPESITRETIARESWWQDLAVPPVERAHVSRYLEAELEEPSSDRRAQAAELLLRGADGSAARVATRLASWCESGTILWGDFRPRLRPGPLPAVAEVSSDVLDASRADAAERRLAAAFAVCDSPVPLRAAVELAGLDADSGAVAARAWLAAGRLERAGPGGLLRFTGQAPCDLVDDAEWARLHARLAERRRAQGDPAVTWAHHAWRAARPGTANEREAAAQVVRGACEDAREHGAHDAVLVLIERLERLARARGDALEPLVRAEAAAAWIGLGAIERAEAIAESLAGEGDGTEVVAAREAVRGRVAFARGEYEAALEAWSRAEAADVRWAREALVARARVAYDARRDEELDRLATALEPRPTGSRATPAEERARANVLTLHAMSMARRGDLDAAHARLEDLARAARAAGDPARTAALEINLGTVERRRGRLDQAAAAFDRAITLLEAGGNLTALAQARVLLGGLLREREDWIAAGPLLEGAAALRERLGDRAGAAAARGLLGLVHADRGHLRAALSELTRAGSELGRLSRRVDAALFDARAEEVRARLGEPPSAQERARARDSTRALDADPRTLLWRARAAWMRRDPEAALDLAQRARDLARRLHQPGPEREADHVAREIGRRAGARAGEAATEDERIVAAVGGAADPSELETLALAAAARGRDDRAARTWFALAARARDANAARRARAAADASFAVCRAGLSDTEARALRQHLLARPDPCADDFATLDQRQPEEEEFPMDVLELLEINRRLVAQQALPDLLGAIVDSALAVTGGERGFVVLEEDGQLAIETALDSRRGDIAAPEVEVSHSIVRQALAKGAILRLSNASEEPELGDAPSVAALELRSILCAPFDIEPGARGVVYVDHRLRRGAFDARAERMLGLLAGQAALALRQVRRIEEIRRLNRELEREVVHKDSDLRAARAALRAAALVPPASGLVGESSAMRAVHELVARAAPSRLPVLVTGPSGTGKELAARALHAQSARAESPFLAENVAALPAALIEAELFGHKKGAYTGADSDRAGLFERANGGTLFLDEIGELGLDVQAKLLRVLETGEVRRLGDSVTRQTDVRLIAATNRDLETEVAAGRFRADLMYRLDALRVAMPPLEQRVSDIPLLVDHFLRLEEAKGGPARTLAPAVMARLCARAWPGNVRELANEVARLCVLSTGDITDPALVRAPAPTSSAASVAGPARAAPGTIRTLAELEREAIEAALAATGGDKTKAAELLGISRAKVYQRVQAWREDAGGDATSAS